MSKKASFKFLRTMRNILLVVIVMLTFDVIVMSFATSHSDVEVWRLLGKSNKTVLNNLLFVEGAIFLFVGALFAGGLSGRARDELRDTYRGGVMLKPAQHEEYREKQITSEIVLMIIGAILIGLSITIFVF